MLSRTLKRYYEPLRLPPKPAVTSVSLIRGGWRSSGATRAGLRHWVVHLPLHAVPATPGDHANRSCYHDSHIPAFPNWPQGRHLHFKLRGYA